MFTGDELVQQVSIQLRVPRSTVKTIDGLIHEGRFKSRSDAIKSMIYAFEEKERTRKFLEIIAQRSQEARENPKKLISLRDL